MTETFAKPLVPVDQDDVDAFLKRSSSYTTLYTLLGVSGSRTDDELPEPIVTHCAKIYLTPKLAIKIKLPVNYSYLQMTRLADRKKYLLRELQLNKPFLSDIYLDVCAIVVSADGKLAFKQKVHQKDEVVEWALVMSRFDESDVLDNLAKSHKLSANIAKQLGQSVAGYHGTLEPLPVTDADKRIAEVVSELNEEFRKLSGLLLQTELDEFREKGKTALKRHQKFLVQRGNKGFVKRCHGDLHLRNILLHKGKPVPFDALEFNERFATTDVLYDLAFLLMDLDHRGLQAEANTVLNEYLLRSDADNVRGLGVLLLFMFCRAGIKAMTSAQAALLDDERVEQKSDEASTYLHTALTYLAPRKPFVIAVGGFSGSGKSTIASKLPTLLCPSPGALLLRSDTERKVEFGVTEITRLSEDHYATPENSNRIYKQLLKKVEFAASATYPIIVDAAFIIKDQQIAIEQIARNAGIPFQGFWLEASPDILRERINARVGDASDATAAVLEKQYRKFSGHNQWSSVDTSGTVDENLEQLVARLSIPDLQIPAA